MHAPVGHAYGCPFGAPIIGRDFFLFRGRSSALRAPGSYNAPRRGAYGYPYGVPIISRDIFIRACAKKCPSGNFGQNYRDLGVNKRQGLLVHFVVFLRAPAGPLMHFVHMGTLWAPIFQKGT